MARVSAVVIGAGNRGHAYSAYSKIHPEKLRITAIAEPREKVRKHFAARYNVEKQFSGWEELLTLPKMADFAMVMTQDRYHKEPAIALANMGYHIMLEKPMAVTESDCEEIVKACRDNGVMLAVCHVLRYAPVNKLIKRLIDDGTIGDVVNIQHTEPVGFFHFAHSFVRGNWRRDDTSSSSLLAKSCHDIDLIRYWMGRKCLRVSSFGSLQHFRKENKPAGATSRCTDCPVKNSCPYSAQKYHDTNHFAKIVTTDADIEDLDEALKVSPYGRCVYDCDNNVVDHQVVNFEFEGGRTASFTMVAFTEKLCTRRTVIHGTKGELTCDDGETVRHFDFATGKVDILTEPIEHKDWGHGGADFYAIKSFVEACSKKDWSELGTTGEDTLRSHKLVFKAEEARLSGQLLSANI